MKKIGLIGAGKMGYNLALNMQEHGFEVSIFDVVPKNMEGLAEHGVKVTGSLEEMAASLEEKKVVFVMVPSGKPVEMTLEALKKILKPGDIVIDGGNSRYTDTVRRGKELAALGIGYMDCGTSGGQEGARNGVCVMVGGAPEDWAHVEELFEKISVPKGYLYTGPCGSGHFCKMVHNGVEYGMMQAMAEGFEVLEKSDFDYDMAEVARVWNNGSVIRSWLMELAENAFRQHGSKLEAISDRMHSTGEGKWTLEEALDRQVATPVIALSLLMRYRSLDDDSFSGKVVSALRNQFGGHAMDMK